MSGRLLSISPTKFTEFNEKLNQLDINTICNEALCPNRPECFLKYKTVTFLVLGNICTRACKYCAVARGKPKQLDPKEPEKVSFAIEQMQLKYVVITSVTRDDLIDGGAEQFTKIIEKVRIVNKIPIEVLIPDFNFNKDSINKIIFAKPNIINHNIESTQSFFKKIRPIGDYYNSLKLLAYCKQIDPKITTKSGFMIGIGESISEIKETLIDLKHHQVDIITIGQYLSPKEKYHKINKIYTNEEFEEIKQFAEQLNFKAVFVGRNVRSSYHAEEVALNSS